MSGDGAPAPRSYYGRPVLKQPVWTPEVPAYFFAGGLAGASAGLAQLAGDGPLARRAWATALAGAAASPALLISDLGVPSRFLNMLRMAKPTSPMSVGTWILSAFGAATGGAAASALTGRLPRTGALCGPAAALLGLPLATYTGTLIAQTAVPVWHGARHELPVVFAAGAALSAGAAATVLTPAPHAAPARRLTALGAIAALASTAAMERRLGELAEPYRRGRPAALTRAGGALIAAGSSLVVARGARSRAAAVGGGAAALAGAALERFGIFAAGFASAADPHHTVGPQRARIEAGAARGAARLGARG